MEYFTRITADTTNCFKNRLDKFWNNQDLLFDYKTELTGIGNRSENKNKLENVAINDVLPLKATRRDAIPNFKYFGASDTRDLTSMITFTFSMRRHLIRLP